MFHWFTPDFFGRAIAVSAMVAKGYVCVKYLRRK